MHHVNFENISFSTKETPDNEHTKGSIQAKAWLSIEEENGQKVGYITNEPRSFICRKMNVFVLSCSNLIFYVKVELV